MSFDPISHDVPYDDDFPASNSGLEILSYGDLLNGVIYHPAGEGLHPLILLLHGFPGHERNFDLAQIFRRAGWHVAVVHYRGAWGSGGDYRFTHVLQDVKSSLDYFRQADNAERFRIDTSRIVAIGHSVGGWAALMAAAYGWLDAVASIAAVNMGLWGKMLHSDYEAVYPMVYQLFEENLSPLSGVTAQDLIEELLSLGADWQLDYLAEVLAQRKLFMIAGKRDELIAPFDHHIPVVKALENAGANRLQHALLPAGHGFDDQRIALARRLLDWLATV